LAQQLRPSSAFSGDILQADEEPGHILANIPSDLNELTDKYGNPLKPEDYWLERISYSIRTPTQSLPLGYHAGSGADGLMTTRYGSSLNGVGKAAFWVGMGSDRLGSSLL